MFSSARVEIKGEWDIALSGPLHARGANYWMEDVISLIFRSHLGWTREDFTLQMSAFRTLHQWLLSRIISIREAGLRTRGKETASFTMPLPLSHTSVGYFISLPPTFILDSSPFGVSGMASGSFQILVCMCAGDDAGPSSSKAISGDDPQRA